MDTLSFDLKDLILCFMPSRKDLLPLAFISRSWYSLIIPWHSEYREVRLSSAHPEIWAHLSHRADLASNIRNVCISEHTAIREAYPKTLVDVNQICEAGDLTRALANMTSLHKFEWASPWYPQLTPEGEHTAVLQVLRESRTLRELAIHCEEDVNDRHSTAIHNTTLHLASQSSNFPLWHIFDLTSLKLFGEWNTPESISSLLKLCAHLQELSITYADSTYGFTSCTFPHLRKLYLARSFRLHPFPNISESVTDASLLSFFAAHSTIEDFRCDVRILLIIERNQLPPRLLPNLKRLETSHSALKAFLYDNAITVRPLESISRIFLEEETFNLLKNLNPDIVCEFRIWHCVDYDLLPHVAELFPRITHLEISTITTKHSGTLGLFTAVKSICDHALWTIMEYEEDEQKQTFFDNLARTCPNLKKCYYGDGEGMMCISLIKPSGLGHVRLELSRKHFE